MIYKILEPIANREYCELVENKVDPASTKVNGQHQENSVKINNPGDPLSNYVDIFDADTLLNYTFNITQKLSGDFSITNSISINIICTAEANTIIAPFTGDQIIAITMGDKINKYFYFGNFTCKFASCCTSNDTRVSAVGSGTF